MKGGVSKMKRRVFQGRDSLIRRVGSVPVKRQQRWNKQRKKERENRRKEQDISNPAGGEF